MNLYLYGCKHMFKSASIMNTEELDRLMMSNENSLSSPVTLVSFSG